MIEIKHRNGSVLYRAEGAEALWDALVEAVNRGADLGGANLGGANLRSANLRSANLRSANLGGANLRSANLGGANLRSADLVGADLRSAYLRSADLVGADLRSADLRSADLRSADLGGADLGGADLGGADLRGADLVGANLVGADLRSADLRSADLRPIKADLWYVLTQNRGEVPGLRAALVEGRINGSVYEGECACLVGTIANIRGCNYESIEHDANNPAERWFLAIQLGHTPENNPVAALTLEWIDQWLALNGLVPVEENRE